MNRTNKEQIKSLYDFITLLAAKDIMLDYYEFADNIEMFSGPYGNTFFKFNNHFQYSEIRKFNSLFTVSEPLLVSLSIKDLLIREYYDQSNNAVLTANYNLQLITFQISKKLLKLIKYDIFYSHSLCDFEKIMVENYKCFSTKSNGLSSNDIAAIILELKKFHPIVIDDTVYLNTQMNTSVEILGHTFETNDIDLVETNGFDLDE